MHEVVVIAVRNAVSAATIIFTASSIKFCFFIALSWILRIVFFNIVLRTKIYKITKITKITKI